MTESDFTPDENNIVLLSVVRASRWSPNKCEHKQILVDDDLAEVICQKCGEKLNPIAVLSRFANQETMWHQKRDRLNETIKKLEEKSRCKCQHCGKMTKVRP